MSKQLETIYATDWYQSTANKLVQRILDTVPVDDLTYMTSPWELFKVKTFHCDDLAPSLFQASWALEQAKLLAAAQQENQ